MPIDTSLSKKMEERARRATDHLKCQLISESEGRCSIAATWVADDGTQVCSGHAEILKGRGERVRPLEISEWR